VTAEALVAGRHVVLPDCAANRPFLRYPNAHPYGDLEGAVKALNVALTTAPESPHAARRDFDWSTACQTLMNLWEGVGSMHKRNQLEAIGNSP
jgi:digalactosyldiacylglycerol synthase